MERQAQYGQINGRQAKIEKFVNRIAAQERWHNSDIDAAVLKALDLLSDLENSNVLDAVCEIYGEKCASARMDAIRRIGANETHE